MSYSDYRQFEDSGLTRLRLRLLRTKGGEKQRDFLRKVRNDDEFLGYLRKRIAMEGTLEVALCPDRLTENEYKLPPIETEEALYDAWADLTPRVACRTTFWSNVTYRHIEHNRICAVYLAANGGVGGSGAERIDRVLRDGSADASKGIDACVRTVLRRLGGLPEARGNRSVYVDCPFGRAWWRERLVREVSGGDPIRAEEIRDAIRVNQTYWEELVVLIVSRNSVLGSREVRDAFLLSLAEQLARDPWTPLATARTLREACRMVGVLQSSRELSVLEKDELLLLMQEVVRSFHERLGTLKNDLSEE